MRTLVRVTFGSHLYGTNTPDSDLDFKSVHIPSTDDILMQRVAPVLVRKTKTDNARRNGPEDVDDDSFSVGKFLSMAAGGDTMAIELLFAPPEMTLASTPEWDHIVANRDRLINRQCKGFVGYCQKQAAKYGIKGSRVAAAREALGLIQGVMETHGRNARLEDVGDAARQLADRLEHVEIIDIPHPSGKAHPHLSVCERKLPFRGHLFQCEDVLQKLVDAYGHRALAAEANQGVDWKAVSHAVRVSRQAIELLSTGHLTFPRPDAEDLLAIKLGKRDFKTVGAELEALLEDVERAAAASTLPERSDMDFIEETIRSFHLSQIEYNIAPAVSRESPSP